MAKALPKFGKRAKVARVWRALMLLAVFVCSWNVAFVTVQAKESEIVIELTFDNLPFNSPFVISIGEPGALPDLVAEYSSGIKRKVTPEAEYEVADPKVARVERVEGSIRLTGVSAGITQLTARYSGLVANLVVYVSEPPPSVRWYKVFPKEVPSEFVHVAAFPDGSFLAIGHFDDEDKMPRYTKIIRVTEDGKILWKRDYRVKDLDTYGSHAAIGPDGKVYIVGYTSPKDINNHVFLLVLRAKDGATLWEKSLGGGDVADYGQAVVPLADGDLVVASSRYLAAYTYPYSVHLWRLDAQGNVRWEKDYRGETRMFIEKGLAVATNGDLFVAGAVLKSSDPNPKNRDWDGFLLRVNPENGSILWSVTFGEEKSGYPKGIVATDDGGVLVVGDSWSHPPHSIAAFLRKFDAQGNEEWIRIFVTGAGRSFEGVDVVALPDKSGYVFVGPAMRTIVRVDQVGNIVWLAQPGDVRMPGVTNSVAVNATGTVLIAGMGWNFREDLLEEPFLALVDPEKRPNTRETISPAAPISSASLANEQTLPSEKPSEKSEDETKAETTSSQINYTPDKAMISAPESSTSRVEKWIIIGLLALLGLAAVGTGAVVLARRRFLPFRRLWDDHRRMTLGVLAVLLLIGLGSGAWLLFKSSTQTPTSASSANSGEHSHIKSKSKEGAVAQVQKDVRLPGVEEPYCDCLADKLRPPAEWEPTRYSTSMWATRELPTFEEIKAYLGKKKENQHPPRFETSKEELMHFLVRDDKPYTPDYLMARFFRERVDIENSIALKSTHYDFRTYYDRIRFEYLGPEYYKGPIPGSRVEEAFMERSALHLIGNEDALAPEVRERTEGKLLPEVPDVFNPEHGLLWDYLAPTEQNVSSLNFADAEFRGVKSCPVSCVKTDGPGDIK